MWNVQVFLLAICTVLCNVYFCAADCTLKFPLPYDDNQPVIFQNSTKSSFSFAIPYKGEILLGEQESITLACGEGKNVLELSNSNQTQVKCSKQMLALGQRRFNFRDFNCTKAAKATLKVTGQSCGQGQGKINDVGYMVSRRYWVSLFKNCYDADKGVALYTEHTIYGQSPNNSKTNKRPSFSTQGVGKNAVDLVFKRAFQKGQFNKLLGSAKLAEKYINDKSYLARGHLAPDADFLFAPWQFSTYFYANVAPQWQNINGGNWNALERNIRKTAQSLGRELTIITGTHDVLTLPNKDGRETEIYLSPGDKIPVPKFFYKILFDKISRKGIVFVSLNNPFASRIHQDDYLCQDVCRKAQWHREQFSKVSQGFIYCCDYSQFKTAVRTAPTLAISQLLTG